jgi:hypothetical protein
MGLWFVAEPSLRYRATPGRKGSRPGQALGPRAARPRTHPIPGRDLREPCWFGMLQVPAGITTGEIALGRRDAVVANTGRR